MLTLSWEEVDAVNKTNLLDRNITLTIMKNVTANTYGITNIEGVIEVRCRIRAKPLFDKSQAGFESLQFAIHRQFFIFPMR